MKTCKQCYQNPCLCSRIPIRRYHIPSMDTNWNIANDYFIFMLGKDIPKTAEEMRLSLVEYLNEQTLFEIKEI